MSGNQEPRISLPTWRCSDFNAAIPIKKRKYFVQPQPPATAQAETNDSTSVGRNALDISEKHKQNMIGPSASTRIADKAEETVGNKVVETVRVKVEEPSFTIPSSTLAGFEIPSSSGAEMKVEHTVLKTHDTVKEASEKENLGREFHTETSAGVSTVSVPLGFETKNNSPYWENQEPTSLDLSLSKGGGVNRTNWDLNTTMDAWEDDIDRNTRVRTSGSFLNSNRSLHDRETSSYRDRTVVSMSDSEKQKEINGFKSPTLTSKQFNPPCSLSLGLSSYPPVEKSPSLSELRAACLSLSRPIVSAVNVNHVNLRTVKSEVIEESVRQETEKSICNSVAPISVKAEPNNFTQSEVFNGTLNHPRRPIMQSNEILDLPSSSTPNQKDGYLPYSSGISNAPMSLKENYLSYTLKENSGKSSSAANGVHMTSSSSGHVDVNLNASGVNVTSSLTEEKTPELPRNSRRADELSISGEANLILSGKELDSGIFDGSGENEGNIAHDGETVHESENPEIVDNRSPVSYKAEISTIENDSPAEFSEGSQRRIINLAQVSNKSPIRTLDDASHSFASLRTERDRLPDFPLESRRYLLRGRGESFKFSHGRYHGEMRSPRLNFMQDRRRFTDKTESNIHDRDAKSFEYDNIHGNTRRGGAFNSNFQRGRRPLNDVVTPFSNSFPRRTNSFSSYTHRGGPSNKEDSSTFHGFRDHGEKFTRGFQSNKAESMFTSPTRPYQGRNGFARGGGRGKFSNSPKRDFADFRSRSPIRSRERSPGPSSSFRNRSHDDFSLRRSPSGYRMGRTSSPEHSGYSRRHNSPPYSHRHSNNGRGRGFARGRGGYVRGRGYGRDGVNSFRKPFDRFVNRNHNNLDTRERDDFFEGSNHSERFGGDVNAERGGQYGYRHDDGDTSSFRPSLNNGDCALAGVENDPDAVRFGQDLDNEIQRQGSSMGTDGKNTNISGGSKNMDDDESSKDGKIWQQDEHGGEGF